jgi:hypothetical protein
MNIPALASLERPVGRFRPLAGAGPLLAFLIGVTFTTVALHGVDTNEIKTVADQKERPKPSLPTAANLETEVAAARERAKLLHDVYSTTLDVMHHHYFRRDGPVLPARAMEDVFEEMAGRSGISANWISVNTKAMSVSHEPRTSFEKKAAAEISAGKKEYEFVGKGVYRRAAVIPLRSGCVGCHTDMFKEAPKSPRFAGLVISIPLKVADRDSRAH